LFDTGGVIIVWLLILCSPAPAFRQGEAKGVVTTDLQLEWSTKGRLRQSLSGVPGFFGQNCAISA
jgi:hypothetical protein